MKKFKFLNKNKINLLPKTPGVYGFKKSREFLYIGKAINLRNRVKQHIKLDSVEFKLNRVEFVGYIKTGSEDKALLLEAKLIKKYQPKYNVDWKDDKNYFYVGITEEAFPRIFVTHQPKLKIAPTSRVPGKLKINYLGPFVNGRELKRTLKELRKSYPYRTCNVLPRKPCLWYHLNQCLAPCLPRRSQKAEAGLFKSKRIEAYDISNIQGQEATGSMVTFINGKPDKNFYRRFKIKISGKPNDIAMLKEVLERRFNHPEWGVPDLLLIDGGKAQLNAALSATKTPAVALAKRNNELYMKGLKKPVLLKNLPPETANLFLRLRDEAHRFAVAYHHILRKKALFN